MSHQATYAHRFNTLAAIRRPEPEPIYVPLTDEQIAALPGHLQPVALLQRDMRRAVEKIAAAVARAWVPALAGLKDQQ